MTGGTGRDWHPYCGAAPIPSDWLERWNVDPVLLAMVALATLLLWRGSETRAHKRLVASAAGLALLLFVSPLLVFALREGRTRWPGSLPMWTGLQALAFWLWHAPGLYAEAMSSDLVYWLMQLTITGTAVGFWAAVRRTSGLSAIAALLVSTVQMGLLGALITFAGAPLYAPHFLTTEPWGLSALEDQQMAGLIMWAPSAGLYLAAALFLAHRWFASEERQAAA